MFKFQPKEMNLMNPTWVYILLILLNHVVDAQSSMEPVPTYISHHSWEPSIAITVGAVLCALLFMALISIYLRNCTESRIIITQTTPCSCTCGINKEVLNTFPIIFYSNVKDLKSGKGELECAVCLSDFKDYDALRLLPKCNHVFHSQCIDSWLASHVTCPVCRANLNQDSCQVNITIQTHLRSDQTGEESVATRPENINNETEPNPNPDTNNGIGVMVEAHCDPNNQTMIQASERTPVESTNISISEGLVIHPDNKVEGYLINQKKNPNPNTNQDQIENKVNQMEGSKRNLVRSNSTGHSLIEQGKNVERYTLRLPEDVRRYILLNHGRRVQRSASYHNVKGLCSSDIEAKVLCTPPFVTRYG